MDKGGENVLIADFQVHHRGVHPGSMPPFLAGKSKHNTRIERLWRDVYRVVIHFYYVLFHGFENAGVIEISNESDLWVLYFKRLNFSKIFTYFMLYLFSSDTEVYVFNANKYGLEAIYCNVQ